MLPIYVSQVPDPKVWKQDAIQHSLDSLYTFLPFTLLCQVLKGFSVPDPLHDLGPRLFSVYDQELQESYTLGP